ncbi:3-oxoacyl-[acyl-carrier-protein] synthase-3 [Variovorax boronicumulans]|uniref:beta-ketoacyl-ACP synthase III n=1 Tax=Variovorax boronicumulans TaxID=436515 RepID=UPI002788D347|nr:beta-ketoacyl-ACP synthase III [Variovorax boronicumulans]MDP9992942.1 3-oxoacyl-[acyl-carrier-protein] synthase-3 [Variovorax boronicumulans]MDQ0003967.1 3-oxoacyl-[acyl-carrier-protein] synthase-3 [Variovorax boronicumulans]
MTTDVFLTRTAAFLPFAPVSNEDIEEVLGRIGGKASRARRLILRSNGIQSRHYAIDRATGQLAMTNAQLTASAIRGLGDDIGPVDCLATGTSLPDQLMPNHAVMVHGELGWPRLEVVACAGICLAGTAALKHAWLSVRSGDARRAVATGSELASAVMRGSRFEAELEHKLEALEERPELAFEKDFLRWMLSDGAGAVLLEREPRGPLSLRIDWIDLSSAAHELPVCMYAGADKNAEGGLDGWARTDAADWHRDSTFAVKQDVRLLNDNIVRATLAEPLAAVIEKRGLKAADIDWFLPHLSSNYFVEPVSRCLDAMGFSIPRERWFSNLARKGNTGSASPYIMLDELFRSGRIQPGHKLLMFVPESGRFSSGFIYMEAV